MFTRWLIVACCCVLPTALSGQTQPPDLPTELPNVGMEEWNTEGLPSGWYFFPQGGGELSIETEGVFAGESAARIDSTSAEGPGELFSNLQLGIDATPFRGHQVRFRAAVRTAELTPSTRVQMWLRVDGSADEGERAPVLAFDNMQERPIRATDWEHFEIVLPVAKEARLLALGIFVIGKGKAWFDDASLEIVDDDTPTTATKSRSANQSLPPAVARAFAVADQAPRQPFFTHWLWPALLAIAMSFVAMSPLPAVDQPTDSLSRNARWLRTYCLRFAALYWGLYCLPMVAATAIPWLGPYLASLFDSLTSWCVTWLAHSVFHLDGELVPPNGSGDTTYNYLSILMFFAFAVVGATIWFLIDRQATRNWAIQDLLRTSLRYTIALAMIGYGLAKVSLEFNQFPENSSFQLDKTWGSSSPMNVLWAFMGASRPYTVFAGLGEVLAAVLIVWRRTAMLGAAIALGVMTNVMMLNYCFDVPVKIYSTHLVVMSLLVLMPDGRRLFDFLVLNRATAPADLVGVWQGPLLRRIRWLTKLAVIVLCIGMPLTVAGWTFSRQVLNRIASAGKEPPASSGYLLIDRGYRWINEVPFNR